MGDLYNIFTKTKLKDDKTWEERYKKCLENAKKSPTGECNCAVCRGKRRIAYKLIENCRKMIIELEKSTGNRVYWSDLYESMVIAATEVRNYIYGRDKNK